MKDRPILCALGPDEVRIRKDSLLPGVANRSLHVIPTYHGLAMKFAASKRILHAIARMIDAERRCCPFLIFRVEVDGNHDDVWLDISGPAGTREFLQDLIAAANT